MRIVGQDKLKSRLDSYDHDNLPKTIMFIGEVGCGKKLFAQYIANKFDFNIKYLVENEDITNDNLTDYMFSPIKTLYIIDLCSFDETKQNKILKFIEEPSESVYTVLMTDTESTVLPTILNRCVKFKFESYTTQQLKDEFSWLTGNLPDEAYLLCRTPGQLQNVNTNLINKLISLCKNITTSLQNAPYVNTISISSLINYKDNYDKFDDLLFLKTLRYCAEQQLELEFSNEVFIIYKQTSDAINNLYGKRVQKEMYIIQFLSNLWEMIHNEII